MSATQLAAFIVAAVLAGALAVLALAVTWRARQVARRDGVHLAAAAVGGLAAVIFGVGAALASSSSTAPASSSRCEVGTYDNGASSTAPHCVPWDPASAAKEPTR